MENAHSLYVETLADTGLVGLVLLGAFFMRMLGAAVRLSVRSRYEARVRAAGVMAALIAFCVAAASDWIWQVPALPAAALLLAAAVFDPRSATCDPNGDSRALPLRIGATTVAIAALVAIAFPLATVSSVRASQSAATTGNPRRWPMRARRYACSPELRRHRSSLRWSSSSEAKRRKR